MPPGGTSATSGEHGFFQTLPALSNQYDDDSSLQRVVKLFFPPNVQSRITPELHDLGQKVISTQIFDWVTDAERNLPYLKGSGRSAFGSRISELVVGEGWRELQKFGIRNGVVSTGYEKQYREYGRIFQFLKAHIWTGSCANVTCPSAMTDGAAKLLRRHLDAAKLDPTTQAAFQEAFDRLTSADPQFAWTSGQWMTERTGGSDVSNTETQARQIDSLASKLGPWSIDGFKWFSSATDSSMAVLLAQSPKGLSAFFAPVKLPRQSGDMAVSLNGVYIQRLKNKFGTKSLPTAELELKGMRGRLIGEEGHGIQEISIILNISRLWSAVSAVGYLGRGIAIVKGWARVRRVAKGQLLKDNGLFMNTLANIVAMYHASTLFVFFVAFLTGLEEHPETCSTAENATHIKPRSLNDTNLLLRVLTPVLKAVVCKRSIHNLQECMEAMGGVGYLDNSENESINISRLYRDCCVLSIWEGTTDVLASDTIRVLKGRSGSATFAALDSWFDGVLRRKANSKGAKLKETENILKFWEELRSELKHKSAQELLLHARDLGFQLGDVVMSALLCVDHGSDSESSIHHALSLFMAKTGIGKASDSTSTETGVEHEMNRRLVYGYGVVTEARLSKI